MTSTTIWNTILITQILDKLRMGIPTDLSAFHYGDIELKAGDILFNHTKDELDEFDKCSEDIIYFVEKYCRFMTDTGRRTVLLREYQKEILESLSSETLQELEGGIEDLVPNIRNMIMMQSRQSGKTTTVAAYFAWYLCFHNDRNLAILANKQATAFEIVHKVTDVFKGLPFFLKPGMIQATGGGMRLDNGCFLTSQATTKTAQIGFTIHVLYADEFAHIQHTIADDFWRSVYPTLASSEISQCVISSTPNGEENVFFEIWDKANRGKSSFVAYRVDWWEVPGHDDEWATQMIADFGEERFAQEFGLDFNRGGSNILLASSDLAFIKRIEKEYNFHELENSKLDEEVYRNLKWHPDFNPNSKYSEKSARFVISIDTGEGKDPEEKKDNDYNVANIFKVEPKTIPQLKRLRNDEYNIKNMFRLSQVGLYRDNIKDEENCAEVTKAIIFDQLGGELCKLLIEMNFNGKFFLDKVSTHDDFYDNILLRTYHTKPIKGEKRPKRKPGFKVTGADKDIFCKLGKRLVSKRIMILNEKETIKEFKAFGRDKRGKWRGLGVHDDIAMSALNVSRLYDEKLYEDWLYDFFDVLPESDVKKKIGELVEKFVDNTDMSDDEFNALYSVPKTEHEMVAQIYAQNRKQHYPGMHNSPKTPSVPWQKR